MFTGIVEELGEVAAVEPAVGAARLRLRGPKVASEARHGDSIAVNGVCLTVTDTADGTFTADVTEETLARSSLGSLTTGSPANLECPLKVADRFGGHIVQGHVDGTGKILAASSGGGALTKAGTMRISLPEELARYTIEKGSIAVDGASLTIASRENGSFTVSLIPTTLELTTLGQVAVGTLVNLEVDLIAKYVERLMAYDRSVV